MKKDIHKQVMQRIHEERIVMRPRWHFVVGSMLLGVGMAGAFLVAGFFVHVVLFHMRVRGPLLFWRMFPGLPLLVAIAGIWGGTYLLRKFDVSYKKSFVGLVIAIVAMVLMMGFLLEKANVGPRMMRMRPLRPLYPRELGERKLPGRLYYLRQGR